METEALKIWVITDGRAGNEAQALGLAEAVARRRPARVTVRRVAPKAWTARLPAQMWHALGAREGGWPFTAYSARVRRIKPPWPDLVIGAGRRIAPLFAALRQLYGVKTVQILDPRMPLETIALYAQQDLDELTRLEAAARRERLTKTRSVRGPLNAANRARFEAAFDAFRTM